MGYLVFQDNKIWHFANVLDVSVAFIMPLCLEAYSQLVEAYHVCVDIEHFHSPVFKA